MKNRKQVKSTFKKLSLNKKSIVLFDRIKGGSEFNTILPSHQSLNRESCPQDL